MSNKSVKVTGEWRNKKLDPITSLRYFKIDGGYNAIKSLQNQCKNEFGQSYKYAQPADNFFSGWHLFGINDDNVIGGIYEVQKYSLRFGK